jgi:hypothetical protein
MMELKRKHSGAANELAAMLWLLRQGYDVFRNVSQHGSIDLIAVRNGEFLKLDVKGVEGFGATGLRETAVTTEQRELDVKILLAKSGGVFEILDLPPPRSERICLGCGKPFMPRKYSMTFCAKYCRQRWYRLQRKQECLPAA